MLSYRDHARTRNNLAFCQLILGHYDEALSNADRALALKYDPLFELNKGIAQSLRGDQSLATESLRHALECLRDPRNDHSPEAVYTLLLEVSAHKGSFVEELPVDAAVLINLWLLREIKEDQLWEELNKSYSDSCLKWAPLIEARRQN
jgi:hypothetical protein